MSMNNSIIEIALTGPDDRMYTNAVYVKMEELYGVDRFRRLGANNHTGRDDLKSRGAQFHKLAVPTWVDPKQKAIRDLTAFASELRDDYYNEYAVKAEAILATLNSGESL